MGYMASTHNARYAKAAFFVRTQSPLPIYQLAKLLLFSLSCKIFCNY